MAKQGDSPEGATDNDLEKAYETALELRKRYGEKMAALYLASQGEPEPETVFGELKR